jgi:hypothetical protein
LVALAPICTSAVPATSPKMPRSRSTITPPAMPRALIGPRLGNLHHTRGQPTHHLLDNVHCVAISPRHHFMSSINCTWDTPWHVHGIHTAQRRTRTSFWLHTTGLQFLEAHVDPHPSSAVGGMELFTRSVNLGRSHMTSRNAIHHHALI